MRTVARLPIAARLEREYPEYNKGRTARLVLFRDAIVGDIRPTLLVSHAAEGAEKFLRAMTAEH